jgi:glycosyltransferase involved in cell wall biosynthesis
VAHRARARFAGAGAGPLARRAHCVADSGAALDRGRRSRLHCGRVPLALACPAARLARAAEGTERAEARLLQGADRVLLQTAADREALRSLVGEAAAARVRLVPNGVREDLFALPEAGDTAAEVLFVAELSGEYAPTALWLLQQVWPAVRAAQPQARLTVVGRGASAALQAAFAATPGVQHQPFADELAPLYARCRVVLSPLWKGYGLINKTLEGLAAGRAVVGGRAAFNGIDGFVDGRDGVALERPDAAALAAAVAALLADPARAAALGRAGRECVRGFRWERTAERLREALAGPRAHEGAVAAPGQPGLTFP